MRGITIVGAGHSGLQLGIGLLGSGYRVRVVSDRAAEQIAQGPVTSSQCMFGSALARERELGLDFWSGRCPSVEGISLTLLDDTGGKAVGWTSRLDAPAQSVDQRVKIPRWIEEFARRGGEFVVKEATLDDLERYARESDLVVVAAGKGAITKLFERDTTRSRFDSPQRALSLAYVTGTMSHEPCSAVSFCAIPGVGEYFRFPVLTTTGPCETMLMEGVPGGPMDCFSGAMSPEQHLEAAQDVLARFLPWEAERCRDAQLTDDLGVLAGRFTPVVRRPVGFLPSGAAVLGMADAVVLNDPITGQGSNNASKCAASYLASILEQGARPFDAKFMDDAFERYWDYARYVVAWTNMMLMPPADHMLRLFAAAQEHPRIARRFANGFDEPRDLFHWFSDPEQAEAYLGEATAGARAN